ncbi:MAG: hypothetical protein Q9P01_09335 [Anaerolineae bacterium]|nr:hypothetical protein [Anaerolineae bacterium]
MSNVFESKKWTKEELKEMGFKQYARRKSVIMARRLPASETPLEIKTDQGDTIIAQVNYMICYTAGDTVQPRLQDYDHWPVEPNIFAVTYKEWDEELDLTPPIKHLMELGCKPYYKAAGCLGEGFG